jgi:fructose-bisphosphate aldolase class II
VDNKDKKASILGAVAGAQFTRAVAPAYGIPVILHSDHCAKKLLPWFDGMLAADKEHFEKTGEPLFSSHMLDLSEEPDDENLAICAEYFKKMVPLNLILEMEIGITGGIEDGVDNSGVSKDKLYTTPETVFSVHEALAPVGKMFTIAAAFGNVHGVYKPGNVKLRPELLGEYQAYAAEKVGKAGTKPLMLVFHGGSGSLPEEIDAAVDAGVVKMNVDTDTQWAYWEGVMKFYKKYEGYLQGQIGNPDGEDKPNKDKYDPRKWVREAEVTMCDRVILQCEMLRNKDKLA